MTKLVHPSRLPPVLLMSVALALGGLDLRAEGLQVGTVLPGPPPVAPGGVAHAPAPTLAAGVDAWVRGDEARALMALEGWRASEAGPWGRERAAGRFLLGWILMKQGRDNEASAEFASARAANGPITPWATWYEAVVDHRRGRSGVAARACASYRQRWPEGPHAMDCLILMGQAYTADGQRGPALAAYQEWLTLNPEHPRGEEVALGMILAESLRDPAKAAVQLRDLTLRHRYHCNAETAAEALESILEEKKIQLPPLDPVVEQQLLAVSLRDCGFADEAWDTYTRLAKEEADEAGMAEWVAANAERFAWRTRRYDALIAQLEATYKAAPNGETAWLLHRANVRAGRWGAASDWGDIGLTQHPTHGRWRSSSDEMAHANQLAGRYTRARELWEPLGKTGGTSGATARFYAAFCSLRLKEYDDAVTRFDALVNDGGEWGVAARYHRARAFDALGKRAEARADRAAIEKDAPESWYNLLLRSKTMSAEAVKLQPSLHRAGRWDGPAPPAPPIEPPALPTRPGGVSALYPRELEERAPSEIGWERLAWPSATPSVTPSAVPATPATPTAPTPAPVVVVPSPTTQGFAPWTAPAPYSPGRFYDPVAAEKAMRRFAEAHERLWPELPAAYDLAKVGLYDLAGPLLATVYEEWDEAKKGQDDRARELRRDVTMTTIEWRALFLFTRDHHHAARFCYGLDRYGANAEEARQALRLAYPAAWLDPLTDHGRREDVDPLLALGLMRQESVYNSQAVSPVGAIGLMQIMPNTGSRVAMMLGEDTYTPAMLELPEHNLRYGVFYLGRLLTRFEGAWPLAVASYNAGPHNIGSWLAPWKGRITMDDWVEQIPLKETRDYVKKVSANYAAYTALYGPAGATIWVPTAPAGDLGEEVVDF
ncbi:MAG: transglycosylase SLT domain-containing protein [Deltaproteobacteria bacterium]|nr:transglycosylase SLT domain-containing protein [Deltaproteobacteria bacterium]